MYNTGYPNYTSFYEGRSAGKAKSKVREFGAKIFNILREFCLETTIHGFNHIAVPNRYFMERLLWIGITSLSIYGVVNISRDQWQRYNENPTVVTLEKDFRNWKFPLPAITECSTNKSDPLKAKKMIKSLWNVEQGDEKFDYYMGFVATVANSELMNLEGFKQYANDPTLDVDLYELAVGVMPDQVVKPTWVDNLNPKWIPVMTESGVCYSTNSVALADIMLRKSDLNVTTNFPVKCKYASFSCYVTLEVSSCIDFYFHSPYDIADTNGYVPVICTLINREVTLSVMESRCGPGVRDLKPSRRGCVYTDESMSSNTHVYGMNVCRRTCRNSLAIKLCGCKPFYNLYEEGKLCNPVGMACLSAHRDKFKTIECACTPQCVDAVYQELTFDEKKWDRGVFVSRGAVRIKLQAPRERYTREIVFHFQDLVVSFGGAAGFFLGASFLSFVEIFYFVLEKAFRIFYKPKPKGIPHQPPKNAEVRQSYENNRIKALTDILDFEWTNRQTRPAQMIY